MKSSTLVTIACTLVLGSVAHAQVLNQGSSGLVSYADDSTARVSVYNASPTESASGIANPACPVRVSFVDGEGNVVGVHSVNVDPSSGELIDQVLPDSAGVPPGAVRADVSFERTKLCTERSIQVRLEFFNSTSGELAANKYEVSTRRGGKIN